MSDQDREILIIEPEKVFRQGAHDEIDKIQENGADVSAHYAEDLQEALDTYDKYDIDGTISSLYFPSGMDYRSTEYILNEMGVKVRKQIDKIIKYAYQDWVDDPGLLGDETGEEVLFAKDTYNRYLKRWLGHLGYEDDAHIKEEDLEDTPPMALHLPEQFKAREEEDDWHPLVIYTSRVDKGVQTRPALRALYAAVDDSKHVEIYSPNDYRGLELQAKKELDKGEKKFENAYVDLANLIVLNELEREGKVSERQEMEERKDQKLEELLG